MASLSQFTGGGGVKIVKRYSYDGLPLTSNSTFANTVTIDAVADMTKTSLNLLSVFTKTSGAAGDSNGLLSIKLLTTTTVGYTLDDTNLTDPWQLSIEVIEYN